MAFFTLPDKTRAEVDHVRRWLRAEEDWQAAWLCMFSVRGEGTLTRPILQVYVPDNGARGKYPPLWVRFAYGRTMVTTQIPDASWRVPATKMTEEGTLMFAPPDAVRRDLRHELEFFSPELAGQLAPSYEEIAEAAYYRYLARGSAPGSAHGDWVAAEQDLLWKQVGIEPDERPQ